MVFFPRQAYAGTWLLLKFLKDIVQTTAAISLSKSLCYFFARAHGGLSIPGSGPQRWAYNSAADSWSGCLSGTVERCFLLFLFTHSTSYLGLRKSWVKRLSDQLMHACIMFFNLTYNAVWNPEPFTCMINWNIIFCFPLMHVLCSCIFSGL